MSFGIRFGYILFTLTKDEFDALKLEFDKVEQGFTTYKLNELPKIIQPEHEKN